MNSWHACNAVETWPPFKASALTWNTNAASHHRRGHPAWCTLKYRLSSREVSAHAVAERVLRYPDGRVRRIRYPEPAALDEMSSNTADCGDASSWGICRDNDPMCPSFGIDPPTTSGHSSSSRVTTSWFRDHFPSVTADGSSDTAPTAFSSDQPDSNTGDTPGSKSSSAAHTSHNLPSYSRENLPSSPAALLALLQTSGYRDEQKHIAKQVDKSYTILTGCPWVMPKPVFVFALHRGDSDPASTYTLPTLVPQQGTASQIAEVCKCPSLENALDVGSVKDGIVCFESSDSAAQYARSLEDNGHLNVLLTSVDSHELFRMSSDVDSVIVLMDQGDIIPLPSQLASSLRKKASLDEFPK